MRKLKYPFCFCWYETQLLKMEKFYLKHQANEHVLHVFRDVSRQMEKNHIRVQEIQEFWKNKQWPDNLYGEDEFKQALAYYLRTHNRFYDVFSGSIK
ncbi:MAG: hypothetical protein HRU15_15545 [Planctomycetes bacterium]|nr:hypothetical protein [Planctomycetota bacterium]